VKWYRSAAENGHPGAQYDLALHYAKGRGAARDDKEAAKWVALAAAQGHVLAQYNLGILYSAGRGVAQNETEAAKWYRLAAEQGFVLAQSSLGLLIETGRGVPLGKPPAIERAGHSRLLRQSRAVVCDRQLRVADLQVGQPARIEFCRGRRAQTDRLVAVVERFLGRAARGANPAALIQISTGAG